MNKTARIKIVLRSDLCLGSGYSYAGVIDSDVVADRYGLPYIPARRLKGCMREAAEMIGMALEGENTIQVLFGTPGQSQPGGLVLENAYLENYAALTQDVAALAAASAQNPDDPYRYSMDAILRQFTTVRAQTAIQDDGTVKDDTLRFIRVVNQTSPLAKQDQPEDLAFYATVIYPAEYERDLDNIIKATRSIGMDRNRGLGNVRCTREELPEQENAGQSLIQTETAEDGTVTLYYTLMNTEPLMISQGDDDESETYVPGRTILGALANAYLSQEGHDAGDEAFRNLFLNGSRTQYYNAYITDVNGARCIPVPDYIRRLKKSARLINYALVAEAGRYENDDDYTVQKGNMPKSLDGQYCTIDTEHGVQILETERQLVYHHRHQRGKRVEAQLYSHLEIREGQRLAGIIRVANADDAEMIKGLLEQGLQLGKSRTAQYGRCVLVQDQQTTHDAQQGQALSEGDILLVSLSAPAVFLNAQGQETVAFEEVYRQVAQDLGIAEQIDPAYMHAPADQPFSMLRTRLLYGYQAIWNLRRSTVAAAAAGSVLVYRMAGAVDHWNPPAMVGAMRLEGCGEIHVERILTLPYALPPYEQGQDRGEVQTEAIRALQHRIDVQRELDHLLEEIRGDEVQQGLKQIGAAELGRVTLMLHDALNKSNDAQRQYNEFVGRIAGIRTEKVCRAAEAYAGRCNPQILGEDLADYWGRIAMEGLTHCKYLLKRDGNK